MKRAVSTGFALFLLALAAAPACDNPRPVAPLNNGLAYCREMRKLCDAPADAYGGVYAECLATGVANVGDDCLDQRDACVEACNEALLSLGGAGGAGGAGGDAGASARPAAGEGGASAR